MVFHWFRCRKLPSLCTLPHSQMQKTPREGIPRNPVPPGKAARAPAPHLAELRGAAAPGLSPGCEILICSWLQTLERNIITTGGCFMSLERSLDCSRGFYGRLWHEQPSWGLDCRDTRKRQVFTALSARTTP